MWCASLKLQWQQTARQAQDPAGRRDRCDRRSAVGAEGTGRAPAVLRRVTTAAPRFTALGPPQLNSQPGAGAQGLLRSTAEHAARDAGRGDGRRRPAHPSPPRTPKGVSLRGQQAPNLRLLAGDPGDPPVRGDRAPGRPDVPNGGSREARLFGRAIPSGFARARKLRLCAGAVSKGCRDSQSHQSDRNHCHKGGT